MPANPRSRVTIVRSSVRACATSMGEEVVGQVIVEVIRHPRLALPATERSRRRVSVVCDHHRHRFAPLPDHDPLAVRRLLHQARQLCLGLGEVRHAHAHLLERRLALSAAGTGEEGAATPFNAGTGNGLAI